MTSIARTQRNVDDLFTHDAPRLAQQVGMRERTILFSHLAQLLILGWWSEPSSGPSTLARFAGTLGDTVCKQDVDCHFTQRTALWLLALLRCAVHKLVSSHRHVQAEHWMSRFSGVFVEDGSTISLPAALASVWRGCGGSTKKDGTPAESAAALKITVRFDLKAATLDGPHVQAGKQHELASVLGEHRMPKGSLWLADIGYWSLTYLKVLMGQGVYFCVRVKVGTIIWQGKRRLDLLSVVKAVTQEQQQAQWQVDVGANKLLKSVRLFAKRVPEAVIKQRRERLQQDASKDGKQVSEAAWELAQWTILLSNVPESLLSCSQAFVLIRIRWQVELLFKLWKQEALVDEWTTSKPWRILCEVYAKLIAMVVLHWILLLSCEDDPYPSMLGMADVLRKQVVLLAHGLCGHLRLGTALRLMIQSVGGGCSVPARSTRLSTSRLIQRAFDNS